MVSTEHRNAVCRCLCLIILLRMVNNTFFKNHEILKPFFEESLVSLDDTVKILLDVTTDTWIVQLLLDDARSGLPWGRLPNCLSVLTDIWQSWKSRHVLPPAVLGAAMVLERRCTASQQYVVTPEQFYRSFHAIPVLREWTEDEVNSALEDEAKKDAENGSQSFHAGTENEPCPPSPVSISASTEARFFEQSTDCGEISPLRGDESPPHKRFKKWYHRELWVDPGEEVPEIPSSPEATVSLPKPSLTPSARGRLFEDLEHARRQMIAEFSSQAVPVFHAGQERFKWGGCRDCPTLSLQPHLNRNGQVRPGQLLLRCSSWFRSKACWFSHPFPMSLFSDLPRPVQDEYSSLKQSLRRGGDAARDARESH